MHSTFTSSQLPPSVRGVRRIGSKRWQDAVVDEELMEAVVLGQLGVERRHEVPALPERHDCPMVPGVGVVFVVRYDGLPFWKE